MDIILLKISQLLQDRKLHAVSEKTGINYLTITRFKNGTIKNPTIKTVDALLVFFGLRVKI